LDGKKKEKKNGLQDIDGGKTGEKRGEGIGHKIICK